MLDRIDQKVRAASMFFFANLVACLFLLGLAVERLGSGDAAWGLGLGGFGAAGFAWAMLQRYGSNGRFNPSRIHRHEKAR